MIAVLTKPADEITIDDVNELIASEVPEGERLEFKKTLSSTGQNPDPWLQGTNRISDRAKNSLLHEAVAFANAYGGALLIGVEETDADPGIASAIQPVLRCQALADRLRLVFRDRVEPQLPRLEIFGVPTNGDNGVVVLRTGQSRLAPHRVTKTRVCPIRRADRCEEMTMREIHDMTLNVSRGLERLDTKFRTRSERFPNELTFLHSPTNAFGFRLTGIPVGDEIRFESVFRARNIVNECHMPQIGVERTQNNRSRVLDSPPDFPFAIWRPVLRGTRADLAANPPLPYMGYGELYCDGLLELGFAACSTRHRHAPISPEWPVVLFAMLTAWADRVRNHAGSPTAEYAIEVETLTVGRPVPIGYTLPRRAPLNLGGPEPALPNLTFPRYSLVHADEMLDLLQLFERDLYNSLGTDYELLEGTLTISD